MSRAGAKTVTLAPTADDAYIAANQTPAAAGDLTLAHTLCDTSDNVRQLVVTTASDESAKTLTFYGRLTKYGPQVQVTIAGPNATTFNMVDYFYKIDRIRASAAFTGNVKVGVTAVGASLPIPVDHMVDFVGLLIELKDFSAAGTPNFTAEFTNEEIQDQTGTVRPIWLTFANLSAKTSLSFDSPQSPVTAVRLKNNSGTGSCTISVTQAGPGS